MPVTRRKPRTTRAGNGAPATSPGGTMNLPSSRTAWAALAFAVYAAAIVASNWLIAHVGIPTGPGGPHLAPVGFGLMAPSGVWAAAAVTA